MNSDDALLFVRVAESLSFRSSARLLGISQSAASKRIARLESELNTTLVRRNSRSISITPAGLKVLDQCRVICAAVELARAAAHGPDRGPVGALQVALPAGLGPALMPSLVSEFIPDHPDLQLGIHYADGPVDLVGEGFDLAIALADKLEDSNLIARRISSSPQVLAASPGYLARAGRPTSPGSLADHVCIGPGYASEQGASWRFATDTGTIDVPVRYALRSNSQLALIAAACRDAGIVYLPEILIVDEVRAGRLRVLDLDGHQAVEWNLYALHRERLLTDKLRVFIDFVAARLEARSGLFGPG
jgi:DNA-binding transcriptional LysR family regulator